MSFQRKFITNLSRRPISTVVLILLNAMQQPNFPAYATTHIRTHNALKALHLDDLFGSKAGGCKPSAEILKKESRSESHLKYGTVNLNWVRLQPVKQWTVALN